MSKVALITGAGSGLGRAIALALAKEGTAIAAIDRLPDGLTSLAKAIESTNGRVACAVADVVDATALAESINKMESQLGPIDLAIANAGIGTETSALDLKAEEMAAIIQVNLIGVSNTIAAVLPGMLRRRSGHVVAISSLASLMGLPRMLGYCASKSGVNALMEGLRIELAPYGIHATTICPGWILTPLTQNLRVPMPYRMGVEEAAQHILWAIRHRKKTYRFPWQWAWRLRIVRWLPESLRRLAIARAMRANP